MHGPFKKNKIMARTMGSYQEKPIASRGASDITAQIQNGG